MAKDEQTITHRFDPSFCIEKMMQVKERYRTLIFFAMVYWGIFFIAVGLLFYEKYIGNIGEGAFWAYLFIIAGLLAFLKAAAFMLHKRE